MEDNKDEASTNKEHQSRFGTDEWFYNRIGGWLVGSLIVSSLFQIHKLHGGFVVSVLVPWITGGLLYEFAYRLYKRIYKQLTQIFMFMGIVVLVLLSVLLVKMIFKG